MSSDNTHQYQHPKIAKNTSNKLPEAFLQSKGTVIVPKKAQKQKIRQQHAQKQKVKVQKIQITQQATDFKEDKRGKHKESRNPFLPIRKWKQQMQKFDQQRKAMEQILNQHRYDHLKPTHTGFYPKEAEKIKYQDFITLTLINKKETSCFKKILHAPTLTVYYLRESLISISIDKAEIVEWIQNCNSEGRKIVEMFWNIPENYYSLIYQYEEGILMETLLDNLSTLPLPIVQNIAIEHFTSNVSIYNSQLILNINEQKDTPLIHFMPIYEETPPLIRSQKLQEIIRQQIQEDDIDRKILWRLGIILMASFFGEEFLRSDLLQLKTPLKSSCCLFHSIIQLDNSICKLYLQENKLFDEAQLLIEYLCHLLSIKKSPSFTRSLSEPKIRKHKFLTQRYESLISLKQLFQTISMIDLEDCNYALGEFGSEHKLHKTLDLISLSLQNINLHKYKNIDFSPQNKNIRYIAQQLGLKNEVQKVANCLKQRYEKERK